MKPKYKIGQKVYLDAGHGREIVPSIQIIGGLPIKIGNEIFYQFNYLCFVSEEKIFTAKIKFLAYINKKIEKILLGDENE